MTDTVENAFIELTEDQIDQVSGGFNEWSAAGGAIVGSLGTWHATSHLPMRDRIGHSAVMGIGTGMMSSGS